MGLFPTRFYSYLLNQDFVITKWFIKVGAKTDARGLVLKNVQYKAFTDSHIKIAKI